MRRALRFDLLICFAVGYLANFLTVYIARNILTQTYEDYVKEHTVADGDVGGIADDAVYQAQSVEDLLSHDTFTILPEEIQGNGYYNIKSNMTATLRAVTLPSGEVVAAWISPDSVQKNDGIFAKDFTILPVGRVVFEDLTKNETFLSQIEYIKPLSRKDFYIDMHGNGGIDSLENYMKFPISTVEFLTTIIIGIVLHMIGVKLKILPPVFPRKSDS